jgi:patatin-related protein
MAPLVILCQDRSMRQKELRIALVCYGGVSLAVYMHGVTKELWHLTRASRDRLAGIEPLAGSSAVYRRLIDQLEIKHAMRLRVLTDIVAGASAGGINGVFLAQAIHSGQSLDPLTKLWLERTDIDVLLDPDARPWSRVAKFWALPIVGWLLRRPGNMISASVAPETRQEVRAKLSRLIRSRWFEAPFSGLGLSRLLAEALEAMAQSEVEAPLLPPNHPIDLFVTATDFKGHLETVQLHSPSQVEESEHRVSIGFRAPTPIEPGMPLAPLPELVFAARATASFPGAFPALQLAEIDRLAQERNLSWPSRHRFTARIMPEHTRRGDVEGVALIDGSVLVNAPFAEAMGVLLDRPAQREIDRRFVYIDPHPDRVGDTQRSDPRAPGFFSIIFGSLSSIPREQPVRDNLETIAKQSSELAKLRAVVEALRPEVEEAVEKLFGLTFFLDKPTAARLTSWRRKAQEAAVDQAGYAFHGYLQIKFAGVVTDLAETILAAQPMLAPATVGSIAEQLTSWLARNGLDRIAALRGGASSEAIEFFLNHDIAYRIRRLRLLARRLSQDWEDAEAIDAPAREAARDAVYRALSLYFDRESVAALGEDFPEIAARVLADPGAALAALTDRRSLPEIDLAVDAILAEALAAMPKPLRRRTLMAYLGFPFYDTVTLPLLRGEGLTEFDPAKVDRISPEDCNAIRPGGTAECLRGIEFYNFGAFFSRAYRENDYLWGRLHGAERMIDLVVSTLPEGETFDAGEVAAIKRAAFLAILDEEEPQLKVDPELIAGLRLEISDPLEAHV